MIDRRLNDQRDIGHATTAGRDCDRLPRFNCPAKVQPRQLRGYRRRNLINGQRRRLKRLANAKNMRILRHGRGRMKEGNVAFDYKRPMLPL